MRSIEPEAARPCGVSANATKGWLCLLVLALSQFLVVGAVVRIGGAIDKRFYRWALTPSGIFVVSCIMDVSALVVVVMFARVGSSVRILQQLALRTPPDMTGWYAGLLGMFVAAIGMHLILGLRLVISSSLTLTFGHAEGITRLYLPSLLLGGAAIEEVVMRGYLYPAFRRTYGVTLSIVIILLVSAITHRRPMLTSWFGALFLTTMDVILCLVRERSRSLWNSMFCHLSYNATLHFGFAGPAVMLVLLFPLCSREKGGRVTH